MMPATAVVARTGSTSSPPGDERAHHVGAAPSVRRARPNTLTTRKPANDRPRTPRETSEQAEHHQHGDQNQREEVQIGSRRSFGAPDLQVGDAMLSEPPAFRLRVKLRRTAEALAEAVRPGDV